MILPYIINTALILATCLVFYKLLLRRETFYRVNRYMLITCLAVSFALPLLQVPQKFSLRKVSGEWSVVNKQGANDNKQPAKIEQQAASDKQPVTSNLPAGQAGQQQATST